MGISHSTARWLAPLSFAVDFAAQNYGMLSTPNMKDIHDANLSFFSPQPYFIAGFFLPQQILQAIWLYRLCRKPATALEPDEQQDMSSMVDFTPYYALGNFCIASTRIHPQPAALGDLLMSRVWCSMDDLLEPI